MRRPAGEYTGSCCLCVPRMLELSEDGRVLLQQPLPELQQLRRQPAVWNTAAAVRGGGAPERVAVLLEPQRPLEITGLVGSSSSSSHVDIEVVISRGAADAFALLLLPFNGVPGAAGAALTYCWLTHTLQVRAGKQHPMVVT